MCYKSGLFSPHFRIVIRLQTSKTVNIYDPTELLCNTVHRNFYLGPVQDINECSTALLNAAKFDCRAKEVNLGSCEGIEENRGMAGWRDGQRK